jgi:hypothetical protein
MRIHMDSMDEPEHTQQSPQQLRRVLPVVGLQVLRRAAAQPPTTPSLLPMSEEQQVQP